MSFLFAMLVSGVAVRLFEAALLGYYQEEFWKQLYLCLWGLCYDVLLFSKCALLLLPLFLLIHHFSPKAARWTLRVIGTIMLLISNAMIMYYVPANIPLDKVFFTYSVEQLVYISQTTGAFVWWGYVGLLLIPILFLVFSGKDVSLGTPGVVVWLGLAVVGLFVDKVPVWTYNDREEMNTVSNKQEVFWKSVLGSKDRFRPLDPDHLDLDRIKRFQSMFPDDDFVDPRFPFCHQENTPDVLSSYFDLNPEVMPDFVMVITEGLGREFSGFNSRFPSATPFLDSLADAGLSWVNCMSSSQRTFAVLPTLFGSLPFGKNGFMQSSTVPRLHSMPGILKDNGYDLSFFYGGWLCFDEMCYFLRNIGVDHYLPDHDTYPPESQNSWGLYDHVLFSEGLKSVAAQDSVPHLAVYLTLTTHDPFDYPDKERYTQTYTDALIQRHQQNSIQQFQYEQYASYLYYDDCLRKFIADYQKLPNYDNTIFIITGDHHFNNLTKDLERYHVPLVIWSPMLKEARRFPALVTHRDLAPSILAMMRQTYGIQSPQKVAWLNTGLDTVSCFRANSFSPAMKVSRERDMFYKDCFLENGMVCRFEYHDGKLGVKPVNGEEMLQFAEEYWAMDDYVMRHDALLPEENDGSRVLYRLDKTNEVMELSQTYPFNYLEIVVPDSLESMQIDLDFDIRIPKQEVRSAVVVNLALTHPDGSREMLTNNIINDDKFKHYGRWHPFSMIQSLRKGVHFEPGDRVYGYFYNPGEGLFEVKDLKLNVIGVSNPNEGVSQ